jgi:hypothetical protein
MKAETLLSSFALPFRHYGEEQLGRFEIGETVVN